MDELDRIAAAAARQVQAEAAEAADTVEALADLHAGVAVATVVPLIDRRRRTNPMRAFGLGAAVAATVAATVVGLVVIAARDDDSVVGGDGPPSSGVPVTTAQPPTPTDGSGPTALPAPASSTSVPPSTTSTPSSTAAPTSTLPPVTIDPEWWILSSNGVGPASFGTPVDAAIALLAPLLGAPVWDSRSEFPQQLQPGRYTGEPGTGGAEFGFPFSRLVCFGNGLCVTAGGATANDLAVVGWAYGHPGEPGTRSPGPALATVSGIGLGSRWADHLDALPSVYGACYSVGYFSWDGLWLTAVSVGEQFEIVPGDGTVIEGHPDPSLVRFIGLEAGELVFNPEENEC